MFDRRPTLGWEGGLRMSKYMKGRLAARLGEGLG